MGNGYECSIVRAVNGVAQDGGESGYSSPSLECGGAEPVTNLREVPSEVATLFICILVQSTALEIHELK